jgi:hypothetical protein
VGRNDGAHGEEGGGDATRDVWSGEQGACKAPSMVLGGFCYGGLVYCYHLCLSYHTSFTPALHSAPPGPRNVETDGSNSVPITIQKCIVLKFPFRRVRLSLVQKYCSRPMRGFFLFFFSFFPSLLRQQALQNFSSNVVAR